MTDLDTLATLEPGHKRALRIEQLVRSAGEAG
jgi:hypothetical protein